MTDNQTWHAPTTGSTPPLPAQTGNGQPQTPPPPGTPHGWTPPPRPGLIPLRPMGLGTILGASFRVMRRNPRATLAPALILSVIMTIVLALGATAYVAALDRVVNASSADDAAAFAAGSLVITLVLGLAGIAILVVATAVLQAVIVVEVARATLGEKLALRQIWAISRGRLGAVIGYTALLALAVTIFVTVMFGVILGLTFAVAAGTSGSGNVSPNDVMGVVFATFGVMLLGTALGGVLALWLNTRLAFVPAAIVLERRPVRASIVRSWKLTRGYFWRTLGILLLVSVIVGVAGQIVSIPVSIVFSLAGPLLFPTGGSPDLMTGMVITVIALILTSALTTIVSAIGLVLQSATASLLYLDLRMRKEGLDLELSRFVEARQTGAEVADPYLTQV